MTVVDIPALKLTRDAYAPFGDVIAAADAGAIGGTQGGSSARIVNQGTALRWDHTADVENLRGARAPLNISVFRCSPRRAFPVAIELLEKHPASTQVFVPMNARRYLVIVAQGGNVPDLATLKAFVAEGAQGVSYRPGIWHHPMIALDAEVDFACLVHETGGSDDCIVTTYAAEHRPIVRVP